MLILTIRTDKPEAEIALFDDSSLVVEEKWEAHRQLSETIHSKIQEVLQKNYKDWNDLGGIVCFKGPGSFTGLRIGLTVGNSLAANLGLPITSSGHKKWQEHGIKKLLADENEKVALPDYGREARITLPRK